jgi:hypothetical protein
MMKDRIRDSQRVAELISYVYHRAPSLIDVKSCVWMEQNRFTRASHQYLVPRGSVSQCYTAL